MVQLGTEICLAGLTKVADWQPLPKKRKVRPLLPPGFKPGDSRRGSSSAMTIHVLSGKPFGHCTRPSCKEKRNAIKKESSRHPGLALEKNGKRGQP